MKKNVLICCRDSQQPPFNTMLRYHNWGKELVLRGYDVTIITSNIVHNTNIDMIDRLQSDTSNCDGVRYVYVKTPMYQGNGLKRFFNMAKYVLSLKKYKNYFPLPDYIIASDAYVYPYARKINKKAMTISDITDLWPLSIIEYAGLSRFNPICQLFYYFEKKAYLKCDALIFSIEGGIDYVRERKYASKIDYDKIFHINMGCDAKYINQLREQNITRLDWEKGKYNIGYCGSIRQANNVKQICDVALAIKNKGLNDIFFRVYGNGDELDSLIEYCKKENIDNIRFYGRIDKEKIPYILSSMDANILTYKQVGLMKYGGSQSKLFDYLAAGSPILCNCKFGYNLIERYGCGVVTKDQSPESFVEAVISLYELTAEEKNKMKQGAMEATKNYDLPVLVDQLEKVFEYLDGKKAGR